VLKIHANKRERIQAAVAGDIAVGMDPKSVGTACAARGQCGDTTQDGIETHRQPTVQSDVVGVICTSSKELPLKGVVTITPVFQR